MMRWRWGVLMVLSVQGHGGVQELQQKAAHTAQSTNPAALPGFVTANPPETALDHVHALEAATEKARTTHPHAKDMNDMALQRPYFVMDSEKDPVIQNGHAASQNPEAFLRSTFHNKHPRTPYEIHPCRESKPATPFKCHRSLMTPTIYIEPAKYTNWWCTSGAHGPDDPSCRAKSFFSPPRKYKDEVVTITHEAWTSTCAALEEKARAGVCRLVKTHCPKGPETRHVSGSLGTTGQTESRPITPKCWRYEYTYECHHPSPNTCERLRKASCEQIQSRCLNKIGEECVEWEQTYRCPRKAQDDVLEPMANDGVSLPKGGTQVTHHPNADMNDALSKLSIFQEIQKDMGQTPTATSITVFRGEGRKCTIAFAGFKNCCTDGKGWGVSLNLAGCDAEERDLADRQRRGLCVTLGTYCAEKLMGVCIRKKRSACCFPSRLSRILHEQGRRQLGIGWGDAAHPDCRGFTPEELARMDFDRLDLSEIFHEIVARTKQRAAQVVQRNMSQRIHDMTKGLTPGRGEGS